MHIRNYLGFICIALAIAMPTHAQNLFQVEVIVFANENPAGETEEAWPQNINLTYPDNIVTLLPETNSPVEIYTKLPIQKNLLNDWRDRLRGSRQYRVLAHTSWLQPSSGEQAGKAVVITGGTQYGDHFELEGSIKIRGASNPLKLSANLWMNSFIPNGGSENETSSILLPAVPKPSVAETNIAETNIGETNSKVPAQTIYTVKRVITHNTQENISLNKAIYLDHPLMGVLVKITEYKPEAVATESPAAVQSATTGVGN